MNQLEEFINVDWFGIEDDGWLIVYFGNRAIAIEKERAEELIKALKSRIRRKLELPK